jgi:DNA-binding NarL/FixJ family response regulator
LASETRRRATVLIVDDHPIVRHGLARLIEDEPDLEVAGSAETAREAKAALRTTRPDVILLDITLGDDSGLSLLKELRSQHPQIPILVLSMHEETHYADRVLRAGAMGYIMKQEPPERVMAAIRQVLSGKVYLSEAMASSVLTRLVGKKEGEASSPVDVLTDRELQVLQLIGRGMSTRQVAKTLHLSVKTVENHREHIKSKLNLQSGSELVHFAVRWHIEGG